MEKKFSIFYLFIITVMMISGIGRILFADALCYAYEQYCIDGGLCYKTGGACYNYGHPPNNDCRCVQYSNNMRNNTKSYKFCSL